MRDVGMMLPGNEVLPFRGSLSAPPVMLPVGTPEKLPVKKAAGIDVESEVADLDAELVLAQRGLGGGGVGGRRQGEEIPGVQNLIVQEFEQGTVDLVGPGLGDHVDVNAEIRAVLGGVRAGLDLDF